MVVVRSSYSLRRPLRRRPVVGRRTEPGRQLHTRRDVRHRRTPTDFRFLPDGRVIIINQQVNACGGPRCGTLIFAGSFDVDFSGEKGLLGVAVHPDFATTGQLFFYYSADEGTDRGSSVSRGPTSSRGASAIRSASGSISTPGRCGWVTSVRSPTRK